jgi:predicted RNA-binding Zn ribbon-like protein
MTIEPVQFVGGALCLDFANTVGGHRDGEPKENLHVYDDLLDWASVAGTLPKGGVARLRELANASPTRAARALVAAKELREAIYEIFVALADGRSPPAADVATLNAAVPEAFAHLQLKPADGAFALSWPAAADLHAPLWPVVKSAVDLLLDRRLRLRACASDTCGWLFIDESKNQSRKWCSMRDCGNRAKVRRFRAADQHQ